MKNLKKKTKGITFPALVWRSVVHCWQGILKEIIFVCEIIKSFYVVKCNFKKINLNSLHL